jgi:hypothetical protein
MSAAASRKSSAVAHGEPCTAPDARIALVRMTGARARAAHDPGLRM